MPTAGRKGGKGKKLKGNPAKTKKVKHLGNSESHVEQKSANPLHLPVNTTSGKSSRHLTGSKGSQGRCNQEIPNVGKRTGKREEHRTRESGWGGVCSWPAKKIILSLS